jgi:hypothetical protein
MLFYQPGCAIGFVNEFIFAQFAATGIILYVITPPLIQK